MIALNVPGYAVPAWHGVLLTVGAVLLTIIFNTVLLRRLPTFEGGMLAIHVFAFIAVFTVLWVMGDRAPAREVFTEWSDPQGWGSVSVFGIYRREFVLISAVAVWCGDLCRMLVSHWFTSW
jgi:choline transport protein